MVKLKYRSILTIISDSTKSAFIAKHLHSN